MYHIHKASRIYAGHTYTGPSLGKAGLPIKAGYETFNDAVEVADLLIKVNPVGWVVVDADTREQRYTVGWTP